MTLRLTILGYEIAKLELDIEQSAPTEAVETLVETVVDGVSDWWVKRMLKRRRR